MNNDEKILREEILERTKRIYQSRNGSEKFVPGVTKVHYSGRVFDESEMCALVDSSLDFWLTLGPKALEFEKRLAEYLGMKRAIVCNSGSSANLLAVSSLCTSSIENKLNAGDEIITVAAAFPTTVAPIVQNNLVPVFVDVGIGDYNINPDLLESAISKKTRGIMFAHTLGNPADMDKIMKIAGEKNLYIIEDACDALDSKYKNKFLGTFGDISTFSFYAAHHITMGEGGAVLTNNQKIFRTILSLRDWGRDCFCPTGEKNTLGSCKNRFNHSFPNLPYGYDHKYIYSNLGYNLKPLDLQCAIGLEQLNKLPEFSRRRKDNFNRLYSCFKRYEDRIILPKWLPESDVSWFAFPASVRDNAKFTRGDIVQYLEDKMIETRMLFGGNILNQPGFSDIPKRIAGNLNNSDFIMNNTFFLGVYPGITDRKMDYVCQTIDSFFSKY